MNAQPLWSALWSRSVGLKEMEVMEEIQQALQRKKSLLRIEQVSEQIQLGRSWIWGAVKRGEFPAPQRLSRRCTRWDSAQVDQWIEKRLMEVKK